MAVWRRCRLASNGSRHKSSRFLGDGSYVSGWSEVWGELVVGPANLGVLSHEVSGAEDDDIFLPFHQP